MKRIAICFSGAIRSFNSCIPSIYRYFINSFNDYEIDIFLYMVHIKDVDDNMDIHFKMRKSNSDIKKILNILKPKKYVIDEYNNDYQIKEMTLNDFDYRKINFKEFVKDRNWRKKEDDVINNYAYNSFGMYYKIFKCNELKSKYETENNFKYDFVWRARLDYIFMDNLNLELNKKTIYSIEDRFATNTRNKLFYTNDKFIGSSSEIMDKVCNLYYNLPKYLEKGIQFDGSTLIQYHIKQIIDNNDYTYKLIGHENTYHKCQGRHDIRPINRIIYINLKDKKLQYELSYYLLYLNYKILNIEDNKILNLFEGYVKDVENNYKIENKEGNIIINDKIEIIYNNENFIKSFIYYCLKFNMNKNIYNLSKINTTLRENIFVRFTMPDKGYYNGKIKEVFDNYCIIIHGSKEFKINKKNIEILKF